MQSYLLETLCAYCYWEFANKKSFPPFPWWLFELRLLGGRHCVQNINIKGFCRILIHLYQSDIGLGSFAIDFGKISREIALILSERGRHCFQGIIQNLSTVFKRKHCRCISKILEWCLSLFIVIYEFIFPSFT